ncbi:hypothetical protein Dda_8368 [Drechslerella dactyloides]|uniref:Uncharacterized protein n=1 Tax=Drechslerella dactyloides TaxID=74499 RepID=A0AAD6IQK1_DREDA|nr:hypothetical protein Dda_8368 [Drechslerella dactyloides]
MCITVFIIFIAARITDREFHITPTINCKVPINIYQAVEGTVIGCEPCEIRIDVTEMLGREAEKAEEFHIDTTNLTGIFPVQEIPLARGQYCL